MAVIRQQERVLDPGDNSVSGAARLQMDSQDGRELVDRETHNRRRDCGHGGVPLAPEHPSADLAC